MQVWFYILHMENGIWLLKLSGEGCTWFVVYCGDKWMPRCTELPPSKQVAWQFSQAISALQEKWLLDCQTSCEILSSKTFPRVWVRVRVRVLSGCHLFAALKKKHKLMSMPTSSRDWPSIYRQKVCFCCLSECNTMTQSRDPPRWSTLWYQAFHPHLPVWSFPVITSGQH